MELIKRPSRMMACMVVVAVAALIALVAFATPAKAYAYGFTQTAATTDSVTISWDDPSKDYSSWTTTGYTVKWGPDSGSLTNSKALPASQTSFTMSGLSAGTKYWVRVEYARKASSGSTYDSIVGSDYIATRVTTPTGVKQQKWWYYIEDVDFTWDKQNAAQEVEWKVVNAKTGKKLESKVETYVTDRYSCSKVKNNAIYTVQMRVRDQYGWSDWSSKAYLFTQPMATNKTKVSKNKLTIAWGKISGATSYKVYVSTKEKSGYKKVATVKSSKSSVTIKKLGKKKISSKKTYYVYVVACKKVGKATYDSGRHYTYKVKGSSGTVNWTFDK